MQSAVASAAPRCGADTAMTCGRPFASSSSPTTLPDDFSRTTYCQRAAGRAGPRGGKGNAHQITGRGRRDETGRLCGFAHRLFGAAELEEFEQEGDREAEAGEGPGRDRLRDGHSASVHPFLGLCSREKRESIAKKAETEDARRCAPMVYHAADGGASGGGRRRLRLQGTQRLMDRERDGERQARKRQTEGHAQRETA